MNIMLDLECLGLRTSSAPIVAIGAVCFDPATDTVGRECYYRIRLASACRYGGVIEPDTVLWWLRQSDAARAEITGTGMDLQDALRSFSAWVEEQRDESVGGSITVWGDGADFDNALLKETYLRLGMSVPWKYSESRCYRTLKNMRPDIPAVVSADVIEHSALCDARVQASHANAILRAGVPGVSK